MQQADGEPGELGGHKLERLVFFSDAVIAIVITLLVLEIEVPHLPYGAPSHEWWMALGELWPSFFAFVLSFAVIGRFWLTHHQLFGRVRRYHDKLVRPNFLFLLAVAIMPFATALLANGLGSFVPAVVYDAALMATGFAGWNLNRCINVLGIADPPRDAEKYGAPSVILAAGVCMAIAFAAPNVSQLGMLTLPLFQRLFRKVLT